MPLATLNHPDERQLLRRVSVCPVPTDAAGNASYALTYTSGQLTQIDCTMAGTTYRRTLTWTGSQLDAVSAWSEV